MIDEITDFLFGLKMTSLSGIFLLIAIIFMILGIDTPVYLNPAWGTVIISGIPMLLLAMTRLIREKWVSSALLIAIAMVASLLIGEIFAAGEVAWIMALGALLEDWTVERAKKGLRNLINLTPQTGRRIVNGKEEVYDIPANVKVMVDGKEGKLADFEIGSGIKITVESEAIVKVEAEANAGVVGSSLAGEVISVNVSAKVIMISYMEGDSEVTAYITCKDSTKFIAMPSFADYTLKKIKVGDTVEAYGAYQNGIFICTGMTIMPK